MKTINCEIAQQLILLKNSGELDQVDYQPLLEHLNSCSSCRLYEADYNRLAESVRNASSTVTPSKRVIRNIMDYAKSGETKVVRFKLHTKVLLYAAAVALLTFSAWFMAPTGKSFDSIQHINMIVQLMSDESQTAESVSSQSESDNLKNLAKQLLEIEGFSTEENPEINLSEELSPTALQLNSNYARQA